MNVLCCIWAEDDEYPVLHLSDSKIPGRLLTKSNRTLLRRLTSFAISLACEASDPRGKNNCAIGEIYVISDEGLTALKMAINEGLNISECPDEQFEDGNEDRLFAVQRLIEAAGGEEL
jgi:hypothetical protein